MFNLNNNLVTTLHGPTVTHTLTKVVHYWHYCTHSGQNNPSGVAITTIFNFMLLLFGFGKQFGMKSIIQDSTLIS